MKALDKRLAALEAVPDEDSIVGAGPATIVWRRPGETTEEAYARGGEAEGDCALVFYWPHLSKRLGSTKALRGIEVQFGRDRVGRIGE